MSVLPLCHWVSSSLPFCYGTLVAGTVYYARTRLHYIQKQLQSTLWDASNGLDCLHI